MGVMEKGRNRSRSSVDGENDGAYLPHEMSVSCGDFAGRL